jgi:pimeloyl-ACP methyl ester carboxylesterase
VRVAKNQLLILLLAVDVIGALHVYAAPTFSPQPCGPSLAKFSARCGTIVVPENPATPSGRSIALNVVIVPALKKTAANVPLFHLEGGPGIAATYAAELYVGPGSAYRRTRDVVLFDQRGTGGSNPLRCPELEHRSPLEDKYSDSDVIRCREALAAKADLASYSTERAADDVDIVRQALGYRTIDIWALSYGTRLAQEYIKRFPDRVSHAVLVGFVSSNYRPPLFHAVNAQRVMDLIFYKCQRGAECSSKYPHLRAEWESLRRSLPITIPYGPFAEALRSLLGVAANQREVPAMIHAAAGGDFSPFLHRLPKDSSIFAVGENLSIVCSEGAAQINQDEIERTTNGTFLGDYRVKQELAACANWPKYSLRPGYFEPLKSSPPILVLAGEMDNVAAPEWGYQFCAMLPKCRYVLVPDMGHGPFDLDAWENGSCFDEIALAFYDQPASLDVSCVRGMRPPPFK